MAATVLPPVVVRPVPPVVVRPTPPTPPVIVPPTPPVAGSKYRVLFILRRRRTYWGINETQSVGEVSSGLGNSIQFLIDMLPGLGVDAKAVEVADNNKIDAAVASYKPTHVILEALWCVPQKFDVLKKMHPRVQWIVRLHSEIPFLSNEGIAISWIAGYLQRGVEIMCNSLTAAADLRALAVDLGFCELLITYGPNFYPFSNGGGITARVPIALGEMHVGCFGAVRPLKNQLAQGVAALAAANAIGTKLRFHVNSGRVEGGASAIVKNLVALFANSAGGRHQLVQHDWLPRPEFLEVLGAMDMSMQVSFSETFNIVSADSVSVGVPVIGSPAISWLGAYAQVDPNDISAMAAMIRSIYNADLRLRIALQNTDLRSWSTAAQAAWAARFAR